MSSSINGYSTPLSNYYDFLDSSTQSTNSGSDDFMTELLKLIEVELTQMLDQEGSQPSSDGGSGGTGGGSGMGGSGNTPSFAPQALTAQPAAAAATPATGSGTPGAGSSVPAGGTAAALNTASGTRAAAGAVGSPSGAPGASSATIAQPPNSINVKDFGATGNGSTDDQTALQAAFNAAAAQGKSVYIPPGTYNHSGVLTANGVAVSGAGAGTNLVATNPSEEAIKLGSNASLANLETSTSAGSRDSQPDEAAVDVTGANDSVSNVTTLGAESNGIRLDGASGAKITGNLVQGSNADGIALMNGSTNNTISGNEVYQAGDDSYSDDSYTFDSKQDSGNVFSNDLSLDNSYGRSFALMGASGDTIKNSVSDGSKWMGIVAGTDSNSQTMNGSNDTIEGNLVTHSNGDAVDVMSAGNALSQSGAGMNIAGNSTSGSEASVLGFNPVTTLTDRSAINASYRPGTGNGANN
jgi:parallel beta-helix repeat protein